MSRLLEADAPGQLLELVPADDQLARLAIHVAQAGPGGDDAVQAAWTRCCRQGSSSASRFGAAFPQAKRTASRTGRAFAARSRTLVAPPRPHAPLTGVNAAGCD